MIIITVTYPKHNDKPSYSKDWKFESVQPHLSRYLAKKMGEGRITRIVVSNKGTVIWDSDRDEDWF